MKKILFAVAGLALVASPAFAKKHCVDDKGEAVKDEKGQSMKRKACKKAGHKWEKMAKAEKAEKAEPAGDAKPAQ